MSNVFRNLIVIVPRSNDVFMKPGLPGKIDLIFAGIIGHRRFVSMNNGCQVFTLRVKKTTYQEKDLNLNRLTCAALGGNR